MDWIDVTNKLMQDEKMTFEFMDSDEYFDAFQEFMQKKHPEEYGND